MTKIIEKYLILNFKNQISEKVMSRFFPSPIHLVQYIMNNPLHLVKYEKQSTSKIFIPKIYFHENSRTTISIFNQAVFTLSSINVLEQNYTHLYFNTTNMLQDKQRNL